MSSPLFSLAEPALLKDQSGVSAVDDRDKKSGDAATAVVGTSLPLPVPDKPESVVSITSQCSYSSTIVHVGDKKPQPESGTVQWNNIYLQNNVICCCIFILRYQIRRKKEPELSFSVWDVSEMNGHSDDKPKTRGNLSLIWA